jgi:uncharacterized phage protein gp47/JayE
MLTNEGFKRKTYVEYIEEMHEQARELYGADVDLTDRSPLGQWVMLLAYQRAEESELTEHVYNSAFIDFAEGISLDYAVKYKTLTRFPEREAVGQYTLLVDPGKTVPAGFIVGTPGEVEFFVVNEVTDVDNDGIVIVDIKALIAGASGNVQANTITEIVTPLEGITSGFNAVPTENGQDRETDTELRNRYHGTVGEGPTVEGIGSKLMNTIAGVRSAIVIENDSDVVDADGRPPHSFEAIVLGGLPADIGQSIASSKGVGIRAFGSETVIVKDASGEIKSDSVATQKYLCK